MMRQEFFTKLRQHGLSDAELDAYAERVVARAEDPYELASRLIETAVRGEA